MPGIGLKPRGFGGCGRAPPYGPSRGRHPGQQVSVGHHQRRVRFAPDRRLEVSSPALDRGPTAASIASIISGGWASGRQIHPGAGVRYVITQRGAGPEQGEDARRRLGFSPPQAGWWPSRPRTGRPGLPARLLRVHLGGIGRARPAGCTTALRINPVLRRCSGMDSGCAAPGWQAPASAARSASTSRTKLFSARSGCRRPQVHNRRCVRPVQPSISGPPPHARGAPAPARQDVGAGGAGCPLRPES